MEQCRPGFRACRTFMGKDQTGKKQPDKTQTSKPTLPKLLKKLEPGSPELQPESVYRNLHIEQAGMPRWT